MYIVPAMPVGHGQLVIGEIGHGQPVIGKI